LKYLPGIQIDSSYALKPFTLQEINEFPTAASDIEDRSFAVDWKQREVTTPEEGYSSRQQRLRR
jgi:hypothetical protein